MTLVSIQVRYLCGTEFLKSSVSRFQLHSDVSGVDKVEGQTYKMDTFLFFPQDVADETTVVDGLGQRLPLNIENVRGGGGQRRIAVFCRYWVINTTEHCLRYKQENSKLFVSGTVLSPSRDGSLPLSGERSHEKYEKEDDGASAESEVSQQVTSTTIFSGTPGALATSPGRCELPPDQVAELIDTNLSLEKMSALAFMFNFQESSVMTIGQERLCVQLGDGTGKTGYESDWSRGFSLESLGVSQTVGWVPDVDGLSKLKNWLTDSSLVHSLQHALQRR